MELLRCEPNQRMRLDKMKKHELFKNVDWSNPFLEKPSFVPNPSDIMDTFYFEKKNE